jgi:hypothetical protein
MLLLLLQLLLSLCILGPDGLAPLVLLCMQRYAAVGGCSRRRQSLPLLLLLLALLLVAVGLVSLHMLL